MVFFLISILSYLRAGKTHGCKLLCIALIWPGRLLDHMDYGYRKYDSTFFIVMLLICDKLRPVTYFVDSNTLLLQYHHRQKRPLKLLVAAVDCDFLNESNREVKRCEQWKNAVLTTLTNNLISKKAIDFKFRTFPIRPVCGNENRRCKKSINKNNDIFCTISREW